MQNVQCKVKNDDAAKGHLQGGSDGKESDRKIDLSDRFLDFADRVASVVEALPDTRLGRRIADQLLRSGTSPLGNYEEACAAESRRDFIHKLGICLKEIRESRAWLKLTAKRNLIPSARLEQLIDESEQLARIIGQSIVTARSKQQPRYRPK